jgi:hypothetical protein
VENLEQILAEETERLRRDQEQERLLHAARAAIDALAPDGRRRIFAELAKHLQVQTKSTTPASKPRVVAPSNVRSTTNGGAPRTLREAILHVLSGGEALGSGVIFLGVQTLMPAAKKDSVSSEIKRMKDDELIVEAAPGSNGWPTYTLIKNGREVR